ncbi:MAG: hypothetical protein IIW49_03160, partial [Treponema sp.]|nr:hypothetical protein [Treponema sp.]
MINFPKQIKLIHILCLHSSFDSVATDEQVKSLFENTVYAEDSGGDPLHIPTFTYEDFKEFHKTYYNPNNCL